MTYMSGEIYVLDKESLDIKEDKTFPLWKEAKEGWGITIDKPNGKLYVSDGTSKLLKINANTLELEQTIYVTKDGRAV